MLIIQIALGIVLAVVVLLFWRQMTILAILAIAALVALVVLTGGWAWLYTNWGMVGPNLAIIVASALIGWFCGTMIGETLHTFLQKRKWNRGISERTMVYIATMLMFIFCLITAKGVII